MVSQIWNAVQMTIVSLQGRSPSQHLQELHVRRKELLSQLSNTQKMGMNVTSAMNSSVADSMATSHSTMSLNNMEMPRKNLGPVSL